MSQPCVAKASCTTPAERRLLRERRAREQAEALLEDKARELYEINRDLEFASAELQRQVAALQLERERTTRLAQTDTLTGLLNRGAFAQFAAHKLETMKTDGVSGALFIVDLDRFKYINDTFGHGAGDHVLAEVSRRLLTMFAADSVIARPGGDEFSIVARVRDHAEAERIACELSDAMSAPIAYEDASLSVGGSVGAALAPEHASNLGELMRFADLALFQAKNDGRGRAQMFNQPLYEKVRTRRELRGRLEAAIRDGEIEAWFQPIVDAKRPNQRRVEVLARWRDRQLGMLSPDVFVPIAEEAGLIAALDQAVLKAASADLTHWFASGAIDGASCNASMKAFKRPDFSENFLVHAEFLGFRPGQLIVEITETAAMDDPDLARRHITDLKSAGVRVALDDFGAGYTNLRALVELPVNSLKFDRSLLREVGQDPRISGFFTAAVQMARSLGVSIVAEGVETARQAELARRAGCDHLQGYLFARPLTAQQCAAWLQRRQ